MNSYGRGLDENVDFADLLRLVNAIPGDFRIRFMTSHPKDATEKLFAAMAECEKCAPHIHLPVQSGSNRILKAMNRQYTREKYLSLVEQARKIIPDLVLTTDVIVGFPGETEEDFLDTLRLTEEVGFDSMFTFLYSLPVQQQRQLHPQGGLARGGGSGDDDQRQVRHGGSLDRKSLGRGQAIRSGRISCPARRG